MSDIKFVTNGYKIPLVLKVEVNDISVNIVSDIKPKRGKWIHHEGGYSDHYECTACGKAIVLTGRWKFCPNCGADMRGEVDG